MLNKTRRLIALAAEFSALELLFPEFQIKVWKQPDLLVAAHLTLQNTLSDAVQIFPSFPAK